MDEPVLMSWYARHTASFDVGLFQSIRCRNRLVFAQPFPDIAAREAYVKGFLDRSLPAPEGFRRGTAAVTWDLVGRELWVSFTDREGP